MKANFKNLTVEVAFDEFKELDVTKVLGNFIHANTSDIGLDDTARAIYHSEGDVEVPDEHARMIVALVSDPKCHIIAGIKKSIINELTQERYGNSK